MDKMTKDEFKRRMRAAEIEKRIKEANRKPVIVDQHGEIQEIPETEGAVTIPEETPKRRPGRPKKERVAAEQEESLRFLIGVARGRTSEIIHNAEAHIKTGQKLTDLAEVYDTHIRRVEEMLK